MERPVKVVNIIYTWTNTTNKTVKSIIKKNRILSEHYKNNFQALQTHYP